MDKTILDLYIRSAIDEMEDERRNVVFSLAHYPYSTPEFDTALRQSGRLQRWIVTLKTVERIWKGGAKG